MLFFGPNQRIIIGVTGANATTPQYENSVKDVIIELNRSQVGVTLLDSIDLQRSGRTVHIIPAPVTDPPKAGTGTEFPAGATVQQVRETVAGAVPKGQVLLSQKDFTCVNGVLKNHPARVGGKTITGTGVGANTV